MDKMRLLAENKELKRQVSFFTTENARLQAIVAKLPITADGVPAVPGMEVWRITMVQQYSNLRPDVVESVSGELVKLLWLNRFYGHELASTLEAAEYPQEPKSE